MKTNTSSILNRLESLLEEQTEAVMQTCGAPCWSLTFGQCLGSGLPPHAGQVSVSKRGDGTSSWRQTTHTHTHVSEIQALSRHLDQNFPDSRSLYRLKFTEFLQFIFIPSAVYVKFFLNCQETANMTSVISNIKIFLVQMRLCG